VIKPVEPAVQAAVPEPRNEERSAEIVSPVESKVTKPEAPKRRPVLVTPSLVREVQRRLKRQGYRIRQVDGRLGPETTKAIWRFQQDVSLQPTGRIDRPLLTSLGIEAENGWHIRRSKKSRNYSRRHKKSWKPSRHQVKEVQRRLALIGFKPGPADGLLGKQTVTALKRFQRHAGLKITGHINKEVLKRLSISY
jgi:peptidoglycan hydrolase-like protein with peptidoglycan-binding domain